MKRAASFLPGLLAFLLAAPAAVTADPRWWTHDLQLTFGPEPKNRPHVTSLEGNGGFGIFVAWEQETASGDTDVYLQATFDGCTWCGPILWASGPGDERRPWIGAGTTHTNQMALQVLFERSGQIHVASDFSIPFVGSSPDQLCTAFAALSPPVPRLLSRDPLAVDSRPRIAVIGKWPTFSHFHAVWQSVRGGAPPAMIYDHDLEQDGTGWGRDYRELSVLIGQPGRNPDLTGDLVAALVGSSVSIAFEDPASGEVKVVRSVDGGLSWPDPPLDVSGVAARSSPSIDSDTTPFSSGATAWNGVIWQAEAPPRQVFLDAAFSTAPTLRAPDFDSAPSAPASDPARDADTGAVVSVWPRTGRESAVHLFWTDAPAPVSRSEILGRGGVLSADAPAPPRDLDAYPLAPERTAPPDPVSSAVHPLSSCSWDDGWPALDRGACAPVPRTSGASQVSSRDISGFGTVRGFVTAFLDDRDGTPQVFFKMNDFGVAPPAFEPASPPSFTCASPTELAARVAFRLLRECPVDRFQAPERIERYLIYSGTGAGGPFPARVEVANVGLSDPQPAVVPGLTMGTDYTLTLIAEDQARNIFPAAFDPRAGSNGGIWAQQQLALRTPVLTCATDVSVACRTVADRCPADARAGNGIYEPGEEVLLELTVRNAGNLDAEGFQATVTATNGTVLAADVSIPAIAAFGGSETLAVVVRIDESIPCGTPVAVDLDLIDMRTRWGPLAPAADELPACDLVTAGPGDPCLACGPGCDAADIRPLFPLRATKAGTGRADVRLDWAIAADPGADSYNTWIVSGAASKGGIPSAREAGPWPWVAGCRRSPDLTCTDAGAVAGAAGDVDYYQVRGVCGTREAAE